MPRDHLYNSSTVHELPYLNFVLYYLYNTTIRSQVTPLINDRLWVRHAIVWIDGTCKYSILVDACLTSEQT